jgi:hypothetical protein
VLTFNDERAVNSTYALLGKPFFFLEAGAIFSLTSGSAFEEKDASLSRSSELGVVALVELRVLKRVEAPVTDVVDDGDKETGCLAVTARRVRAMCAQ